MPVVASSNAAVAKKVVDELYAWLAASSVLLGLSASIVGSFAKGIAAATSIAGASLDALVTLFGAFGLAVSLILLYHIARVLWSHSLLPNPYEGLSRLDEEGAVRLIKDAISLYRGYAPYVAVAGGLLADAGAILIAVTASWMASSRLGVGEGLFRLAVSLVYLGYGALDLHLERKTVLKRLAAARRLEAELSKFVE